MVSGTHRAAYLAATALLLLANLGVGRCGTVIQVRAGESIQAAVDAAQPGDTIVVGPGVYTATGTDAVVTITTDDLTLIKADQIALEVYWRAPADTRQRIVGLRDQRVLPTNIRYHLDHLTVVQDDFGDLIRLGDGDEVEAVVHPAAPGSRCAGDPVAAAGGG